MPIKVKNTEILNVKAQENPTHIISPSTSWQIFPNCPSSIPAPPPPCILQTKVSYYAQFLPLMKLKWVSGTYKQHKVPKCNFHLITYFFKYLQYVQMRGLKQSFKLYQISGIFTLHQNLACSAPSSRMLGYCSSSSLSIQNSTQVILQWEDGFWLTEWPLNLRCGKMH